MQNQHPRIDSPQNQHVRFFRSLQSPKGRRERSAFLAEGPRVVAEALRAGWDILAAAVCQELVRPAGQAVVNRLRDGPWPCYEMSERAFRALSAEQNPQGVAIAARQRLFSLDELGELVRGGRVLPVAWNISDPGNMGTLIRTAEFLGAPALVAVGTCVDFFEPKVVRATAGTIFHLPLARAGAEEFLDWALSAGLLLVVTVADDGVPPDALDVGERAVALLLGNEAHGLPPEAVAAADMTVTIPRRGKTESLNVAVAAGIILWALTTRE